MYGVTDLDSHTLLGHQVTPILKELEVLVRAIVAPFPDAHAARLLSEALRRCVQYLDSNIYVVS